MEAATPRPGLILAGLQSGSGKTAVTCMLLASLVRRGAPVQPFKVGPDFLDPAYHDRYAGRPSRNHDVWLMGSERLKHEANTHGAGRVGIVEGVMGLFDGSDAGSDAGSTMDVARLLGWPVVLVLPCAKAGRSLAAALRGFAAEAGAGWIRGVILNQVSGESHAEYLREAIAPLRLPVLGAVPRNAALQWPERHLGLQASQELALPGPDELADLAERFLDVPAIAGMLAPAAPTRGENAALAVCVTRLRLAVAHDEAFHFYYESNLDYLRRRGAELVNFSPLHDRCLPGRIDGIILGGGFPECFAEQLSANAALRTELHEALGGGMSCYAECGGLMLLAEDLVAAGGRRFPMVGAVPGRVEMTDRLQHFGYCRAANLTGAGEAETAFHGHEFHHSRWCAEPERANLWEVTRKRNGQRRREGFSSGRLHASYVHLYFPASAPVLERVFPFGKEGA
jgi:cobyrinic acid a,c-diamide synthase